MGCLYLILALISPRILLVVLWLFTDYVDRAFDHWIWPLFGVIFLPFTTLALTWAFLTDFGVLQIAAVVVGVLLDLGSSGGAERHRRSRE